MAQHCLFKAIEWKNKDDNSTSRRALAKAESKYLNIKICHILHKYNLAKPEYLNLMGQPKELFRALYLDTSIVDHFSDAGVNEAVRIIADSSKMNEELLSVKKELLMEWLSVTPAQEQYVGMPTLQLESIASCDYVKRCVYMLKDGKDPIYISILVNSIFMQEDMTRPIQKRLRSIKVLLSIVPHEQLFSLTGMTYQELTKYLESCEFVYDLERAGIVYAVNEFDSLPKDNMVQNLLVSPSIWRCTIAAKLAVAYDLRNPNFWNKIISYLHSHNQVAELEKCLVSINKWSRRVLDMELLVAAWSTVLKNHDEKRRSSGLVEEKESSLLVLCPVWDKLKPSTDKD